jgi:hypothetical protein
MISPATLEAKLWENVQKAYGASQSHRAGDNPEYAKALAEFDRVANPPSPATNSIPFRKAGARS